MPAVLVFLLLLAASCSSVQNRAEAPTGDILFSRPVEEALGGDHWITHPGEDGIPVIGIADRAVNRAEAVANALADAARKISLYFGVSGEVTTVLRDGSNTLDYFAAADYRLVISNGPETYLDALVFDPEKDVLEKNGSVYVRARYAMAVPVPAYTPALRGGVPAWVRDYRADIPGYLAGVGAAGNQGAPQKTCRASYQNAVAALLSQLSTRIDSYQLDAGGNGSLNGYVSTSVGELTGVMILETWFDAKTGAVWTLIAVLHELPRY